MPPTSIALALAASGLPPFDFADLDRASLLKVLGVAVERIASLVMASNDGYWFNGGDPFVLRQEAGLATKEGSWRWVAAPPGVESPLDTGSVVTFARLSEPSLPSLPTELLHELLSHCDKATLSSYCQASSSSLELASPMLWSDVALKGARAVDAYIRGAQPSYHTPLLASLLPRYSLDCVRTLALPHLASRRSGARSYPLPRLLSLDTLRITVCYMCCLAGSEDLFMGLNREELVLCNTWDSGCSQNDGPDVWTSTLARWTLARWTSLARIRIVGPDIDVITGVLPNLFRDTGLSASIVPVIWDLTELGDRKFEPSVLRDWLDYWLDMLHHAGDPPGEPWLSSFRELDVLVSGETHRALVQGILDQLTVPGGKYSDLGCTFVVRI